MPWPPSEPSDSGTDFFGAYVEVLLTGRSGDAWYTLNVTAAKR